MTATPLPTLRPLRVGEILDRAIRLYRRNFLQFVGIIAVVQIPLILVQLVASLLTFGNSFRRLEALLQNPAGAPQNPFQILGPGYAIGASLNMLVSILSLILVQGVATAALTRALADDYLGHESYGSVLEAYRRIKGQSIPMVGALLLAAVLGIGIGIWWIVVPCLGWITGMGMLLFLWGVIIPLLAPVIVLEKQPAAGAWRRAWDLARQRFWWVLGFAAILTLFNWLIVAGPSVIITLLGQTVFGANPLQASSTQFTIQTIFQSLSTLVTSILYLPLQVAAMMMVYVDLRVRKEGLDLALLAGEGTGGTESGLETVAQTAPPAGRGSLITGSELSYFALITIGLFVLIFILYAILFGAILLIGGLLG